MSKYNNTNYNKVKYLDTTLDYYGKPNELGDYVCNGHLKAHDWVTHDDFSNNITIKIKGKTIKSWKKNKHNILYKGTLVAHLDAGRFVLPKVRQRGGGNLSDTTLLDLWNEVQYTRSDQTLEEVLIARIKKLMLMSIL
tara:strand:- start:437 stop:850 length:414 start_codon:yes stop_codon:yes gene_type:complete